MSHGVWRNIPHSHVLPDKGEKGSGYPAPPFFPGQDQRLCGADQRANRAEPIRSESKTKGRNQPAEADETENDLVYAVLGAGSFYDLYRPWQKEMSYATQSDAGLNMFGAGTISMFHAPGFGLSGVSVATLLISRSRTSHTARIANETHARLKNGTVPNYSIVDR